MEGIFHKTRDLYLHIEKLNPACHVLLLNTLQQFINAVLALCTSHKYRVYGYLVLRVEDGLQQSVEQLSSTLPINQGQIAQVLKLTDDTGDLDNATPSTIQNTQLPIVDKEENNALCLPATVGMEAADDGVSGSKEKSLKVLQEEYHNTSVSDINLQPFSNQTPVGHEADTQQDTTGNVTIPDGPYHDKSQQVNQQFTSELQMNDSNQISHSLDIESLQEFPDKANACIKQYCGDNAFSGRARESVKHKQALKCFSKTQDNNTTTANRALLSNSSKPEHNPTNRTILEKDNMINPTSCEAAMLQQDANIIGNEFLATGNTDTFAGLELNMDCDNQDSESDGENYTKYQQHTKHKHNCFCPFCDKTERNLSRQDLLRHIQENHATVVENVIEISCVGCHKVYRTSQKYPVGLYEALLQCLNHMVTNHEFTVPDFVNKHQCEKCPFSTLVPSIMRRHVEHHNTALVKCNHCNKMLKPLSLKGHMRKCGNPAGGSKDGDQFSCPSCSKIFQSKGSLRLHVQRKHDQSTLYLCSSCPRSFFAKADLERHMFSQHKLNITKRDIIQCHLCEFKTLEGSLLRRHIKNHQFAHYTCDICSKAFYTENRMKSHMMTHTATKKHQCAHCSYVTARRYHLERHVALLHSGQQWKCSEKDCSFLTYTQGNLVKHMERVHDNVNIQRDATVEDHSSWVDHNSQNQVMRLEHLTNHNNHSLSQAMDSERRKQGKEQHAAVHPSTSVNDTFYSNSHLSLQRYEIKTGAQDGLGTLPGHSAKMSPTILQLPLAHLDPNVHRSAANATPSQLLIPTSSDFLASGSDLILGHLTEEHMMQNISQINCESLASAANISVVSNQQAHLTPKNSSGSANHINGYLG